jgi:hypothetical protein
VLHRATHAAYGTVLAWSSEGQGGTEGGSYKKRTVHAASYSIVGDAATSCTEGGRVVPPL